MLDKKYLTKGYLYDKLLELTNSVDYDVAELETYTYSPAYTDGWEHNPEPEEEDWDENEELCACYEELQRTFEGHPADVVEAVLPYEVLLEVNEDDIAKVYTKVMELLDEQATLCYNDITKRRPSKWDN